MIAGGVAGVAGNPTDVVNVRMQNDGKQVDHSKRRNYRNVVDGFVRICREEGAMALFRGLNANVNRAMLMTASQLGSYDVFKSMLIVSFNFRDGFTTHFFSSLLAGLVATTVCSPLDVVKTRLMNQGEKIYSNSTTSSPQTRAPPSYRGTFTTISYIVRREGVSALFKGWVPSYFRLGPQTILTFLFLERMKSAYLSLR